MKIVFLIIVMIFAHHSRSAECLKDIAAVGFSADSVAYKANESGASADLISDLGYGFKFTWLVFCPDQNIEYGTYIRIRQYSFKDANNFEEFSNVPDSVGLLSYGLEAKIPLTKYQIEIPIDVELREEISFSNNANGLEKVDYSNLKIMAGLRKFLWQKGKADFTGVFKLGGLISLDDKIDNGSILGISGEYFYKLTRKSSGKLDLYYDYYSQKYEDLEMNRHELGLRANYIFRF